MIKYNSGDNMKNIELKNCPNCHERIGIQDIECPYCKYIDDPKYKKYNEKLAKNKRNKKSNKNDVYKLLLFIPIISYLIYILINLNLAVIIIPLILLNIMCFFAKKVKIFAVMIIEIIVLSFNFINNIYQMFSSDSFEKINIEILIFILGIILVIIPKLIYFFKTKKKKRKKRKNRNE